jgi:hypothetical protein
MHELGLSRRAADLELPVRVLVGNPDFAHADVVAKINRLLRD